MRSSRESPILRLGRGHITLELLCETLFLACCSQHLLCDCQFAQEVRSYSDRILVSPSWIGTYMKHKRCNHPPFSNLLGGNFKLVHIIHIMMLLSPHVACLIPSYLGHASILSM